jgi:hypothetical protein
MMATKFTVISFTSLDRKWKLFLPIFLFLIACDSGTRSDDAILMEKHYFNLHDPNNQVPFGSLNPSAPLETNQFDFMIGKFICNDSLLVSGQWRTSKAIWESHYALNGYGVRDVYRNENYAGESMRYFNTSKNKWDVFFFGMPGEHTGLWEGKLEDGKMIMRQKRTGSNEENLESRLIFYDITDSSFKWRGGVYNLSDDTETINWKITAKLL